MSRQLVKVPNEDDLFFRSSHSAGYHNRAYSEDQHMLTYLDDQDRLSIHMLDSYPITLRERNYEKPILRKTEDGDFAGLITSNRAAFSRIHPTSASLGDLKPTVQVKSFNESSSGQSGTDIFVSGVHGKSIVPQVKPETAVRKSSANRDLSTDLSLGYGNRYDALGLNQKYEDEGISKDVVSGATDDQLGKVYVKVGEEDKVPDMSEGERLVLHVNLRMDLEEDELV